MIMRGAVTPVEGMVVVNEGGVTREGMAPGGWWEMVGVTLGSRQARSEERFISNGGG